MMAFPQQDQSTKKEKYIGWHVVAFLDLLGQQDALRKLIALPDLENIKEVDVFKHKINELYAPLYALRKFFSSSIKSFIEGGIDTSELSEPEKELLKLFRSTPIVFRQFSDSVIVHIPIRNNIEGFPCRAIYGVLVAAAQTFLSCMSKGWAIRGGIELGLAMDIDEDEIYGPALARAYTLESKVAQYPRIVIGEELTRYLQEIAGHPASNGKERAHAGLATKSLKLLVVDDDGHSILDYLGGDIRDTLPEVPITREIVVQAYNFVIQESYRHKISRNSKLGFRYTLLRNYFESRLQDWGVAIQEE